MNKSIYWCEKSAKQEQKEAQNSLANIYKNGI